VFDARVSDTCPLRTTVRDRGFFTLGGVLARVWRPAYPLLPWALTSALLTVAAMWDYWRRGGPIDYVVLGLAAYELMFGLMVEETGIELATQDEQARR
jgi:hypothetical protein